MLQNQPFTKQIRLYKAQVAKILQACRFPKRFIFQKITNRVGSGGKKLSQVK